ncbi:hypothetical protein ACFX13_000500 [Malus domestica]
MPAKKKPKTHFAVHEDSPATPKLVIDLTFSKSKKEEATRSVFVVPAVLKATSSIVDRIAQRISSYVPPMSKFVPKRPSGAKFGSSLERVATMNSDKVPLPAKVAPISVPSAAEIDSSAEKNETTHAGSREIFTKSVYREVTEICALLKLDLLEDIDVYAKFIDGVKGVVGLSFFVKHTIGYRKTALLTIMQKMAILAADAS